MTTEYTTKRRVRQYRKNGNEYAEHWLANAEGGIKVVSPMQFRRSLLPDTTTQETLDWVASTAIGGLQFNKRVEAMLMMRDKGLSRQEVCKAFGITI